MYRIEATEDRRGAWQPVLLVDVQFRGGLFLPQTNALIDTGADCSIVPGQLLELFDIPFESLDKVPQGDSDVGFGLGGAGIALRWAANSTIQFKGIAFCEAGFMVGEPGGVPNILLGREDFLKVFDVRLALGHEPPYVEVRTRRRRHVATVAVPIEAPQP
jgi:hypothetical protein